MEYRSSFLTMALCALISLTRADFALADEVTLAVATNFANTMEELETDFEASTDHTLIVVTGSTGRLYAQIVNGAPFDIFLSADTDRPAILIEQGQAEADSHFTYATGQLALWSADPDLVGRDGLDILQNHPIDTLAIANPALAPYGAAAEHILNDLNPDGIDAAGFQIVMGENIGQAFLLAATGNAQLGLVSLSQILGSEIAQNGSWWIVPAEQHPPIHQDAVLLNRARSNAGARDFMNYLASERANLIISSHGYIRDAP